MAILNILELTRNLHSQRGIINSDKQANWNPNIENNCKNYRFWKEYIQGIFEHGKILELIWKAKLHLRDKDEKRKKRLENPGVTVFT